MSYCSYPSNSNQNVQTPYEKRLFSNVNGGAPLSCPRWEATGEYHAKSVFDPSTNTWKNADEEVVVKYSYYLVKGSKFKNNDSNEVSTLHEDVGIKVNGRIKVKYGDSYMIIGLNTKDSVEVTSPIISVGGFGVKTNGTYSITLVEEAKVRVSKNEKVILFGPINGETQIYLNISLNDDMVGTYVSSLPLEEKKKEVKQVEIQPSLLGKPSSLYCPNDLFPKEGVSIWPINNLYGKRQELIKSFESILDLIDNVESKIKNVEYKVNSNNTNSVVVEFKNNIDKMLDKKLQERELDDVKNKLKTLESLEEKVKNLEKQEIEPSKECTPTGSAVENKESVPAGSDVEKESMEYLSAEELREKIKETEPLVNAPVKILLSKELLAKLQS
jgi:hypothetical protein